MAHHPVHLLILNSSRHAIIQHFDLLGCKNPRNTCESHGVNSARALSLYDWAESRRSADAYPRQLMCRYDCRSLRNSNQSQNLLVCKRQDNYCSMPVNSSQEVSLDGNLHESGSQRFWAFRVLFVPQMYESSSALPSICNHNTFSVTKERHEKYLH